MFIKRKRHYKQKRRTIKVTIGQMILLFPEISLLCKAAKRDFELISGLVDRLKPAYYYCGITNDPTRRESEHNAKFLECIDTHSRDRASRIEKTMEGLGFDTGRKSGNGGTKDSSYIYVYRKIKGKTIEIIKKE